MTYLFPRLLLTKVYARFLHSSCQSCLILFYNYTDLLLFKYSDHQMHYWHSVHKCLFFLPNLL